MRNWDERFSTPGYVYGTEPNDFLRENAHRIPPGPVLCLGDGEGRNGVHLATLGHDVTSVDGSAVGLEKARRLAASRGVSLRIIHADLADYVVEEGVWAGIVSIFCHLPRDLRARVHASAVRGLAPGGVFLLEAYTPRQLALGTGGPSNEEYLMAPEGLEAELAGLRLDRCEELRRPVVEGLVHTGEAAVVQVVGLKPT
ncbi:MAG: SAM-dependent methyltransferase [Gemmatimonadota bacterium]